MKFLFLLIISLLAFPGMASSPANDQAFNNTLEQYNKRLNTLENEINLSDLSDTFPKKLQQELLIIEQFSQNCQTEIEKKKAPVSRLLESLGEAVATEDSNVKKQREELSQQKAALDNTLSLCQLMKGRVDNLNASIQDNLQQQIKNQLFDKQSSYLEVLSTFIADGLPFNTETSLLFTQLQSTEFKKQHLDIVLLYSLAGLLTGFFWLFYRRKELANPDHCQQHASLTLCKLRRNLIRSSPILLFSGLGTLGLYFYPVGDFTVFRIFLSLFIFSLGNAVVRVILHYSPADGFLPSTDESRKKINVAARVFLFAGLIALVSSDDLFYQQTPNIVLDSILNALAVIIGLSAIRIIWLIGDHFLLIKKLNLHLIASLFLALAVVASFIGYRNLSLFLFEGILGTLFVLLMFWLIIRITSEMLDSIDKGETTWAESIRQKLGINNEHPFFGLIWIKLIVVIIAVILLVLSLLAVWGISEQNYSQSVKKLLEGINIGDVTIEPLKVLLGILVAVVLINLSNAFKRHLAQQWFNYMQLSRGAKDAAATITGYIGTIFAIIVGLSVAGLELANLAIIVGALSVGIGFGLQNIVNNFVSGLILLFERPISRGDLIKVGDNMGHVKDISTRSTTIRTFDAADIIVPNSELISGQVTNLMLDDTYARVSIPIGVAYGSDTQQVMELLAKAANDHPDVVKDKDNMLPNVFFMGFGDNSLDFQLYCFVRDISKRLRTQSDLNLAIDQAFRDAGIDIPFPQRTVHFANQPEIDKHTIVTNNEETQS